jgi:signal transduction histidine kinase
MNLHSLLKELKNSSPEKQITRLKSLKASATTEQLAIIEQAAEDASQPWLQSALLDIVNSRKKPKAIAALSIEPAEKIDVLAIKSEAVSDSIGQVLHELEPIIGSINLLIKKEIPNYSESGTKYELEKLNEIMETFEDWRKVEQTPRYKECEVYKIIHREVERIRPKSSVDIILDIPQDAVYFFDQSLLRIIVSNALRNSVESSNEPTLRIKKPIIIKGSITDKSIWVCIIDDGLGLQNTSEVLLKSQHTTKPGNKGLGLAIIDKAISAMNGEWHLSNSKPNGAELYFEIPKKEF